MEFTDVVRKRRMVRRYDPARTIERPVLEEILTLATRAPSAGFSQGWHFLVLDTDIDRARFWAATTEPGAEPDRWLTGMRTAPTLILALSDKQAYLKRYAEPDKGWTDQDEARWPVPYWHIDTGMASLLVLLGAVDRGLAGCFFGVPVERQTTVYEEFNIPRRLSVIGVISLGYPTPDPAEHRSPSRKRGRRALGEVVSYGSISETS